VSNAPATLQGRLALALVALLFSLLAVELGVRLLRPQSLGQVVPPPLLRGQLTRPGVHPLRSEEYAHQVHVNQRGFVDREWGEKLPGSSRVVLIGDSFVQAAQVPLEDGLGRVLEEELQGRDRPVEVLSMGVPGAGTATALGLLERYALPREPDLAVLGFLLANDVLNNHPLLDSKTDKPYFTLRDGQLVPTDAQDAALRPLAGPLWARSHAWRWCARTLAARRLARLKLERGGGMPLDLRVHDPQAGPLWEEAWSVTEALLQAMSSRCREAGVPFAILLIPDQIRATRQGLARASQSWPALEGWDLERAAARAGTLAEAAAPTLDLAPALRLADDQGAASLYYPRDGHWTARGHRVAAQASAEFLAALLADHPAQGQREEPEAGDQGDEADQVPAQLEPGPPG